MTSQVVQDIEVAAVPSLVVVLKAAQTMVSNITTGDAATAGLRAGPALQVFIGTLGLQAPTLATAELSQVGADAINQLGSAVTKLEALAAAAAAKAAAPTGTNTVAGTSAA